VRRIRNSAGLRILGKQRYIDEVSVANPLLEVEWKCIKAVKPANSVVSFVSSGWKQSQDLNLQTTNKLVVKWGLNSLLNEKQGEEG
jgi:hypothetical protein